MNEFNKIQPMLNKHDDGTSSSDSNSKPNVRGYRQENEDDMINLVDNLNRADDLKYNRRAFLKTAVGTSVALALATMPFSVKAVWGELKDEFDVKEIASVDDIPVGESYQFQFPTKSDPAVVVRLSENEFVSYNIKCTHLQCPVYWEKQKEVLMCPCHKGSFNVKTGHPIAGPPKRELPKIELLVENGKIYAVGRKIRHGG